MSKNDEYRKGRLNPLLCSSSPCHNSNTVGASSQMSSTISNQPRSRKRPWLTKLAEAAAIVGLLILMYVTFIRDRDVESVPVDDGVTTEQSVDES